MSLVSHCPDSWQMGATAPKMVSRVKVPMLTVSLETGDEVLAASGFG